MSTAELITAARPREARRGEKRLSARGVVALTKPGRYADGGCLYLEISRRGGTYRRSWVYLFNWQGKSKALGLGAFPQVPLAEAREHRDKWRKVLASGHNPIEARRAGRGAGPSKTFGECAEDFLKAKSSEWRNAKHRQQWRVTLETYAKPLWPLPVDRVDTAAVLSALQSIWHSKPETASRVRGRVEAVLDAAKSRELRGGENPARWRGHLNRILPRRHNLTRGHHAALPYAGLPGFIAILRAQEGVAARALEFLILTASRTSEVTGALWDEVNLEDKVWTIPASRMKAGRPHRVPLSDRAIEVLSTQLAPASGGEFVFPTPRNEKKPLSNMAFARTLKRMKVGNYTAHGFRSSFRDWAFEKTDVSGEVCEAALAHSVGSAVEAAYRRGSALEKRRNLMEVWASFIEPHVDGSNVVPLRAAR